jgi:hypothetical protein
VNDELKQEIKNITQKIADENKILDDLRDKLAKLVCPYKVGQRIVNTSRSKVIWEIVDIHRPYPSLYPILDFGLTCRRITKNGLSKFTNEILIYSYEKYEVVT